MGWRGKVGVVEEIEKSRWRWGEEDGSGKESHDVEMQERGREKEERDVCLKKHRKREMERLRRNGSGMKGKESASP